MKYFVIASVILLLFINVYPGHGQSKPQSENLRILTKVEHFYVFAEESNVQNLFRLFRDDFQLPQVWAYKNWGSYSSGGVSLGNVVLEFATYSDPSNKTPKTEFQGIVFEPTTDADATVSILKSLKIPHDEPFAENPGWTIIPFSDLPPVKANIMICDYKDRKSVAEGRERAAAALKAAGGGALGIVSLKEIVVGVTDIKDASAKWRRVIGGRNGGPSNTFKFTTGPQIRLVQTDVPGILRILVRVRSLSSARRYLEKQKMLNSVNKSGIMLLPSAIGDLSIFLVKD